jgi:hypothetical protein
MTEEVVHIGSMPTSVRISDVGVTFTEDIAFQDWSRLMETLSRMETAFQFAIGDALAYGQTAYGEKYSQAMDSTGHSYQALANYCWVSKSVPIEVRQPGLSWTHHRIVAKLPPDEQESMLTASVHNEWTIDQLAEVIRGKPVEPKVIETVKVPTGMAPAEAEKILKTAQKCGNTLCDSCPYR